MWKDVTPAIMSDEEDIGNNTFKIHRPEWRSDQLNELLGELDTRANTVINKAHPRKNRVVGTPCKTAIPCVKDWMIYGNSTSSPTF